ncbi:cell division protein FtsA [Candidatus Shapirobacteria bacterium CG08_land_8_20_14_0_20_39_18]|uniref:Cell division protein FtsA n=1 Tax=Candidatus Shapirobacteria bacterium CG08_land_8_20_14_0_20_39_18 TaxID=1974883 RepID=A0A2M6XBV9_9BACT|nr:MAG: cell division protein FtsA [Candidatus Shapirobacteria bacterium CG08_land_8_20_14_0_20_39_18]PIY65340.1 MAG: cell division protein FtsA [Candidatus Shapirobacteria bacterium CG_4_10_14_0_8_um_filter_39_15]PJE68191.1 MAG: cell division protein FtsA [Candidatus Shapirobacteria bacterium CG10_big_fil_rev_8_21_14_0_10_38_8]
MASKIIAGLDIGSSKIGTIIAQFNLEDAKTSIIGVSSTPSAGIRKGQVVNIEEATTAIISSVEAAERMAGYSVSKLLVSVGGAHIASQNSKGVVAVAEPEGEIGPEDVRRVIEAARAISLPSSREIIHCLPRYFTVDSQDGVKDPLGMNGIRLEVETHIISGSSTSIKNLSRCVSEVGADIDSMVFSGIASAQAVLTETEKELGVVLVDVGGGTTSLVIYIEGAPSYTSVLPIGAKNVTNDLAIGLRLSLENAEKLKIALSDKSIEKTLPDQSEKKEEKSNDELDLASLGINEDTKTVSRKTITEGIIKPRLNEIFTMVGLEIKKSGFAGMTPSGIVLTGGGALTVGAVDSCKRTLSMPVRIGIPTGLTGLVEDVLSPVFATVLGLILYRSSIQKTETTKVSLINFERITDKIPIGGLAHKAIDFIKSLLP